jgi:hypothetical protein
MALKESQRSLKNWTKQKWQYSSDKEQVAEKKLQLTELKDKVLSLASSLWLSQTKLLKK